MFNPTNEQREVLQVLDKSAIVSAGAGSGKTTVLIEKISQCLLERNIDISNILALTYTNSAAAEMRDRLANSVVSNLAVLQDDKVSVLVEQLTKLTTADMSTFHSFYERIVKKYFYVTGINPSFEILSEEDATVLKYEAFEETINELKKRDFDTYLTLSDIFGKKRNDNSIREKILKLDQFLSSQVDQSQWLNNVAKCLYESKKNTYDILQAEIAERAGSAFTQLNDILKTSVERQEDVLSAHINECCSMIEILKRECFQEQYNYMQNFTFPVLRGENIASQDLVESVKKVKEGFKTFIRSYREADYGSFDEIEASFEAIKKNVQRIIDLYQTYSAVLSEKKKQISRYEFSDLEDMCRSILENEKVCEEIKDKYRLIFVDEFQDINPIQYDILQRISSENNLFLVGDPKQSIYAFRQSDVDIFVNIFDKFSLDKKFSALTLKDNFRSNPKILNFANKIFNKLMTKTISGVAYKEDAQFSPKSNNSCDGFAVNISMIREPQEEKIKKDLEVYDILTDNEEEKESCIEAVLIAHQIGKEIKNKIYNPDTFGERDVTYSDIAILIRNRSPLLEDLKKEFTKKNIPYIVEDKINLLESKENQLIISLFNICNNSYDDQNLVPILSAFGGLNYDDLAKIRTSTNGDLPFYICCKEYSEQDEIFNKINRFFDEVKDLRTEILINGVIESVDVFLAKHKFFESLSIKKNGDARREQVKQFLDYIHGMSENRSLGLLIDFFDKSKELCVSSVKRCDNNAITITTIHSSKGLEYPIVFLADTGRDSVSMRADTSGILIDKSYGIAIKNYNEEFRTINNSVFERAIMCTNKKRNFAENLRLLYVALTRAKNKLFISGKVGDEIKSICDVYGNISDGAKSYMEYILGALDNDEILKINTGDCILDGVEFKVVVNKDFVKDYKATGDGLSDSLKKTLACLSAINDKYKFEGVNIAQKTTVTKIMQEENLQEMQTASPIDYTVAEKYNNIDNTERGILLHSVLEKIDFTLNDFEFEQSLKNVTQGLADNIKELILKNVKVLRGILPCENKNYCEKSFMLNASLNEIYGCGGDEKTLIQGKIDLLSIGNKTIIVDYKYTQIRDEDKLKNKYKRQLIAYAFAVEKCLNITIDTVYLLNLSTQRLIEIKAH